MSSYTLWAISETTGDDVVLVVEAADGTLSPRVLVRGSGDVRAFLATHGMPHQITANSSAAVRLLREAEPRLFLVPATVLKPKELAGPLATLLLHTWRRERR